MRFVGLQPPEELRIYGEALGDHPTVQQLRDQGINIVAA